MWPDLQCSFGKLIAFEGRVYTDMAENRIDYLIGQLLNQNTYPEHVSSGKFSGLSALLAKVSVHFCRQWWLVHKGELICKWYQMPVVISYLCARFCFCVVPSLCEAHQLYEMSYPVKVCATKQLWERHGLQLMQTTSWATKRFQLARSVPNTFQPQALPAITILTYQPLVFFKAHNKYTLWCINWLCEQETFGNIFSCLKQTTSVQVLFIAILVLASFMLFDEMFIAMVLVSWV